MVVQFQDRPCRSFNLRVHVRRSTLLPASANVSLNRMGVSRPAVPEGIRANAPRQRNSETITAILRPLLNNAHRSPTPHMRLMCLSASNASADQYCEAPAFIRDPLFPIPNNRATQQRSSEDAVERAEKGDDDCGQMWVSEARLGESRRHPDPSFGAGSTKNGPGLSQHEQDGE